MQVKKGLYKHFKGGLYNVLHIATNTENLKKVVVYSAKNGKIWVRDYDMFCEKVSENKRRFERI